MDMPMSVDPIAWAQLPPDAQRLLSGHREAKAIELWFEDDGTPSRGSVSGCSSPLTAPAIWTRCGSPPSSR